MTLSFKIPALPSSSVSGISGRQIDRARAHRDEAFAYILIAVVTVALFSTALSFVPAQADDLVIWSSVANRANPLTYFAGDWGMGNDAYRPLHSISIWLMYHMFGLTAFPNQAVNVLLHFLNACILFKILRTTRLDPATALMLTCLFLVSMYTLSPATYVSDRPTLMVGLCLLLMIQQLARDGAQGLRPFPVAALSLIALMSKESGLIVPALAFVVAFVSPQPRRQRSGIMGLSVLLVVMYAVLRFAVFGSRAASYSDSGYLLGVIGYNDWATLPMPLRIAALGDNVLKNFIAPVIPLFGVTGRFPDLPGIPAQLGILIPTFLLFVASIRKSLSQIQMLGLLLIGLNALIHYAEFRFRVLYLAHLGFILFLAGSPFLQREWSARHMMIGFLGSLLLLSSALQVRRALDGTLIAKDEELNTYRLQHVVDGYRDEVRRNILATPIDPRIVAGVLERYSHDNHRGRL